MSQSPDKKPKGTSIVPFSNDKKRRSLDDMRQDAQFPKPCDVYLLKSHAVCLDHIGALQQYFRMDFAEAAKAVNMSQQTGGAVLLGCFFPEHADGKVSHINNILKAQGKPQMSFTWNLESPYPRI